MIERYAVKEIEDIFSLKNRYESFLKVELAVLNAYVKLGIVPEEDYLKIKKTAKIDVDKINELEKETKHDVIAFTRSLSLELGEEKKWIHYNLTSTDVVDTALSLNIKESNVFIFDVLKELEKTLNDLAIKYEYTPIIGRTHGIHGEVTSFGLKWALFLDELKRDIKRLKQEQENVEVAKISGTVGNFANLPYEVEGLVAEELGLFRPNISTQVLSRDRLAGYVNVLSLIASLFEKISTEIRHFSRTEVNEVNEYFSKNQKGSSAMPHKRNPVSSENICGLSRIVKSSYMIALENNILWHERDISHSSNERIYLPDDISLIIYMARRLNNVLKNIVVHEDKMKENIFSTYGVIFSGRVMNYIIEKHKVTREEIYDRIQLLAFKAMETKTQLKELLKEDVYFSKYLNEEELNELFSYDYVFKNVDKIYKKVGVQKWNQL